MSTVSEASENHGTESMDNSRLNSDSTSKPVEDRRSATASDAPEAETGSNEAMHHSILLYDSDSKNEPEEDNNTFLFLSSSS